jgi:hypothetical protein
MKGVDDASMLGRHERGIHVVFPEPWTLAVDAHIPGKIRISGPTGFAAARAIASSNGSHIKEPPEIEYNAGQNYPFGP